MKTKRKSPSFLSAFAFFTLLSVSCTHTAPFLRHTEDQPMHSYLAMNLPYERYQKLLQTVEAQEGVTLKNRGEAHITVVSPVEYDTVLKKHLSIEEIHVLAETSDIQKIEYKDVSFGGGEKKSEEKSDKTYFVVVTSPGLLNLREKIGQVYKAKGGAADEFRPANFYPHITLGFTDRDLHAEDGVIKDPTACVASLPLKN
jgi:2'-5' RNA ligase